MKEEQRYGFSLDVCSFTVRDHCAHRDTVHDAARSTGSLRDLRESVRKRQATWTFNKSGCNVAVEYTLAETQWECIDLPVPMKSSPSYVPVGVPATISQVVRPSEPTPSSIALSGIGSVSGRYKDTWPSAAVGAICNVRTISQDIILETLNVHCAANMQANTTEYLREGMML